LWGGDKIYIAKQTGLFAKQAGEELVELLISFYKQRRHCLLFVETKVDMRTKQSQSLSKNSLVEFKKLTAAQASSIAIAEAKAHHRTMSKEVADYMVDRCGGDYNTIVNEMAKLAHATESPVITVKHIDEHTSRNVTSVIFELAEQVCKQKYAEAFELYDALILRKESPLAILALMYRQFRILYQVKLLTGFATADIANACNVQEFVVLKNKNMCSFTTEKLEHLLMLCAEYDYWIKTGKCKDDLAVKLLILRTAEGAI
jgi:DNA polymerase-3 subunit delta